MCKMNLLRTITASFGDDLYIILLNYLTIDDRLNLDVRPAPLTKSWGMNTIITFQPIRYHTFHENNKFYSWYSVTLEINETESRSLSLTVDKENTDTWMQFSCRVISHYRVPTYTYHNKCIWKLEEPRERRCNW